MMDGYIYKNTQMSPGRGGESQHVELPAEEQTQHMP